MLRSYAQLARLPNVFTALADVTMGYLFTHRDGEFELVYWVLAVASAALYTAGMVLNDVFDYELDRVERPERPLPRGEISLATAQYLGFGLLAFGLVCGWLAGAAGSNFRLVPGQIATMLVVAILLYDKLLKATPVGPLAMGACRMLNVLLGMSGGSNLSDSSTWLVALGIGIYITGLTWFARTEAVRSSRPMLIAATAVLAAGVAWLGHVTKLEPYALEQARLWPWLWLVLGGSIVYRFGWAIADPEPWRVQQAVKNGIMSLVVLDAAVAFSAAGHAATAILLLLVPAVFLGRWLYST
ncbi:MAG TPA: UbiA family prenyltransferase [Pirellulales bacterium]|jgi:4-hydroxybenzoate polyprenyltransferase|nr:UbiA family prenyltransferase [Pirellulales bacterium]